jgi:hypothetical protein
MRTTTTVQDQTRDGDDDIMEDDVNEGEVLEEEDHGWGQEEEEEEEEEVQDPFQEDLNFCDLKFVGFYVYQLSMFIARSVRSAQRYTSPPRPTRICGGNPSLGEEELLIRLR